MKKNRDFFELGFNIGVDAIENLENLKANKSKETADGMAGLLSAILDALYFTAPDDETAEAVLEFAKAYAQRGAENGCE